MLIFRLFLGIRRLWGREEDDWGKLFKANTAMVWHIYSILWLVDPWCLSQVLTERELHHILLSISLKQVLFIEENLAYVTHVLDRFFSIQLYLPYKYCQFLPHPGN